MHVRLECNYGVDRERIEMAQGHDSIAINIGERSKAGIWGIVQHFFPIFPDSSYFLLQGKLLVVHLCPEAFDTQALGTMPHHWPALMPDESWSTFGGFFDAEEYSLVIEFVIPDQPKTLGEPILTEQPSREEILNRSINLDDFSIRTYNCLVKANIQTFGELMATTEYDLMNIRNFGRKSLFEIKDKLNELGLSLLTSHPALPAEE